MSRRLWFVLVVATGCTDPPAPGPEPPPKASSVPATGPRPSVLPSESPACPPEMVLVEGRFCPAADERCEEYDPEYVANPDVSERCRRFTKPSQCASSKRRLVRYCVDRYEWPNRTGELPKVLVDFKDASTACQGAGKRLCEETEWVFACEGEDMLPYTTGYERDPTACVMDRPYHRRARPLERWDECMANPDCKRDFARLDQREASGASPRCVSPFGIFDMNGNVNEWVTIAGERYPHRGGLKGGWWGPVRDRCRPTVRFHDESDWGYEIGFRCCKDARP